ncbi:carbamoyltransferase HypF [Anaerobacillus arseniciselenatis]|uniref:Carbamoyltransferase n=1 Tax=Anaerobacillus arseniciselenatis TaxID=85682 RepID=A0A1S2LWP6_9BACI|nr:carbamoyltransferase HypF [Anaerobacillus arseniciselenatis]OIJ15775.1 carbamoyltransferase HypF [Anaerobacillus arseniciselenatis]
MKLDKAVKIVVKGRVQGVGFRPFVFSIAKKYSIKGTVQNNMDGVNIVAEGTAANLHSFIEQLQNNQPRLARIDHVQVEATAMFENYQTFTIIESDRKGKSSLVIPVDASVCPACIAEMTDESDFRYNYPFINCTECGPRYTIIKALPYDRPFTTMEKFKMCPDCKEEYEDPLDRRHHAQPIACPSCGPKLSLLSMEGTVVTTGESALEQCKCLLAKGAIVAIKGIGGFHLACDATNETAVRELRNRKKRPKRPLAVMANERNTIEEITNLSEAEKHLLDSPESPIVVVKKNNHQLIPECVAPGMKTIGVMLPYTPLHKLLFMKADYEVLIMTSANPSGLPMLYQDNEIFSYLRGIADFILTSDREIEHPLDDSVVQIVNNELQFFRRARGYVPDPFFIDTNINGIVALGPQQKNTFAIGRGEQIFIGPHIGDMGSVEVTDHFLHELKHLMKWVGIKHEVIAVDKHPNYETTSLASEMECNRIIKVQHHHAHHVSCMVDNQIKEACFGIILDGTGYGDDGNIWGFELLYGDALSYERLGHMSYYPLPGGEKAVKEPWRNAISLVLSHCEGGLCHLQKLFPYKKSEIETIQRMLKQNLNSPLAGTCGRLFDAVSALLKICDISTHDGEAAIRLSELTDETEWVNDYYQFSVIENGGLLEISLKEMVVELLEDIQKRTEQKRIVQKFHRTIVEMCLGLLMKAFEQRPYLNKQVVLSGGSFHNRFLFYHLVRLLKENGFEVFTHKKVPCNDGGVSLGQLVIASAQTTNKKGE